MTRYKSKFSESLPQEVFSIKIDDLMTLSLGGKVSLPSPVLNFWKVRLEDEDEFLLDYKGSDLIRKDMVSREFKGKKYSYVVQVPKTQASVLDLIKSNGPV